jgi:structural maintenance of chromosome 3 (chondroitin sulfate proteoglycan 6)
VIVGRNGSGKSNFFAAIRFVLSDAYTQMGREERQALLHEGSGSAVMSAYVEIIFDNTDGRFPTGKEELILRRTIGLKKDEYSLDRKNATKTDVMNLLESAGFSRSNPYYIVPQGRVTTLTNMKDTERLTLLKEVAGTQVYEARRTESLKIMTETNNKREKIDELLTYLNGRLSELEEEKEELKGYQNMDKDRRCLEYTFYHREQVALGNALDEIEESRQEGMDSTNENREIFMELENSIAELDTEINKLNSDIEMLRIERRSIEEDRREAAKSQAKVELEIKALTDGQSATEQARRHHQQDMKAVKQEIAQKESELANIVPGYSTAKASEAEVKTKLDSAEASRQRLYAKQGRSAQFKNKSERDKFLKKEIDELNTTVAIQKANKMDGDEEVKGVQSEIHGLEGEIAGLRERLEGWGGNRQALSEEVSSAKDALERLSDERKLLYRENDKLQSVTANSQREKEKAEIVLSHSMDGNTAKGLATVRRLKREHNITGAYGTLADLMEVGQYYRTAVEQTAGNSLFHYIVDNADTATYFVNELQKNYGGRVTFVPLSQLHSRPANLPKANDAIPMIDKIKFDPMYEKAMAQVFGKTIICPNLIVAGQYARSHGVNAVTTDGDTANKKGAMTGGYIDPGKSRLEAVHNVEKWRDNFDEHRSRGQEIRKEIEAKDQEITSAAGALFKLEQKLRQLDDGLDPVRAEVRRKSNYLDAMKDSLDGKTRRIDSIEAMLKQYTDLISAYNAEQSSEFKKSLSNEEEQQLESLNASVLDLKAQWNGFSKNRRELENRKNLLEVDLRENLRRKLDELNAHEMDSTTSGSAGKIKEIQRELKRLQKAAQTFESKLEENEQETEQSRSRAAKLQAEKNKKVQKQDDIAKHIESFQKRMEKSIAKKALLVASATECAKNIRDLGVLPEEAFEKYEHIESHKVHIFSSEEIG